MKDIPNTVEVKSENKCDVCRKNIAAYYNLTFYIHVCSRECWEKFIEEYYKEIDAIAIKEQEPDKMDRLEKREGKDSKKKGH